MNIDILKGKTLTEINVATETINFHTSDGEHYQMFHSQNCCERVTVEDVIGDIEDLLNSPILEAEEVTSKDRQEWQEGEPDSFTWTFYKLGTFNGSVTIRWYGRSNGYYSERVDFEKID